MSRGQLGRKAPAQFKKFDEMNFQTKVEAIGRLTCGEETWLVHKSRVHHFFGESGIRIGRKSFVGWKCVQKNRSKFADKEVCRARIKVCVNTQRMIVHLNRVGGGLNRTLLRPPTPWNCGAVSWRALKASSEQEWRPTSCCSSSCFSSTSSCSCCPSVSSCCQWSCTGAFFANSEKWKTWTSDAGWHHKVHL